MKIYLDVNKRNKNRVRKQIEKFRTIDYINDVSNRLIVILKKPVAFEDKNTIKQLQKKFNIPGVTNVIVSPIKKDRGGSSLKIKHKNCHCFFDIDSTLTKGDGNITSNIQNIFKKMKADGFRIYFASGRQIADVQKDMKDFGTEKLGIAENGGIILGMGPQGEYVHGDRTQPDKLDAYLKRNCKTIKEDIEQGFRRTERIYLDKIPLQKLKKYKKASKAKVEILASKTAYHVSKMKINKGSAIGKLKTYMNFGPNDIVVSIGDADMDIPMFNESELSYVVGNGSKNALKEAKFPLEKEHDEGIEEFYNELKKLVLGHKH